MDRGPDHSFGDAVEPPVIGGARVGLRGLRSDDAPALFDVFGDPEVTRFWSAPPLPTVGAAAAMIARIHESFRARRAFQWGIRLTAGGPVLGTCSLFQLETEHRRAEVGIALGRRAWGQGIATEALELAIGFAFATLGLHRLEADIDPENHRSLRLFERQGFRREGYLRQRWHQLGELRDAVFLALLRPEWTGNGAVRP